MPIPFSPTEVAAYLAQANEKMREQQALLGTLEDDRRKVRTEMDGVMRLYLDQKISGDGFASQYGPLEVRFKQLSEQIPEVQGELDFLKIRALSGDEILTEARDLYGRWPDLTRDEKRRIIETVTEKITVGKDDVTIDLCYLPSAAEKIGQVSNATMRMRFGEQIQHPGSGDSGLGGVGQFHNGVIRTLPDARGLVQR